MSVVSQRNKTSKTQEEKKNQGQTVILRDTRIHICIFVGERNLPNLVGSIANRRLMIIYWKRQKRNQFGGGDWWCWSCFFAGIFSLQVDVGTLVSIAFIRRRRRTTKKKICKLVGLYVVLHSQTLYISITIGRTHFTIRNAGENAFQFFERIFAANETGQTVAVLPQS